MTDLSRVEELLLELVTQQERLIDRVERLEGVMTELHHDRESDVREAVVTAIGSELQLVVVNLEQIKD